MRTTVTLDENLIKELMKFSDTKTKTAAVALAVKDQIRRAKLKRLANLLGTAVNPNPDFEQLGEIAISSSKTASRVWRHRI
jgi:hypothetical protein